MPSLDKQSSGAPLAGLYSSDYDFENLKYPRDLGESNRGHYVVFYINAHKNSQYKKDVVVNPGGSNSTAQTLQNNDNSNYITAGSLNVPFMDYSLTLGRQTTRIKTAIALYMPQDLKFQYSADWSNTDMTDALGKVGFLAQGGLGLADAVIDKIKGNDVSIMNAGANRAVAIEALQQIGIKKIGALDKETTGIIMHAAGYAVNPQIEVLFKGTQLRQFQFSFKFSAFNPDESVAIQKIIKTFKFHQAPEIAPDVARGRYLIPPSEFDIEFYRFGLLNDNISKISTCVLQSIDVNYSPSGVWATFPDGSPVQMQMDLQFQEVEIMTKQRIEQGF